MFEAFFSLLKRKFSTSYIDSHALTVTGPCAALCCDNNSQALQLSCPLKATFPANTKDHSSQHHQRCQCFSCKNYVKILESWLPESSPAPVPAIQAACAEGAKPTDHTHSSPKYRQRLLTWIQPGLAGLMDGSVSTLAPIFAAAFATGDTHKTFLIGLSASIGAGLSMGFTEAAHDDGKLSGRGSPLKRGIANGIMTTLGGLGHTLPYLLSSFYAATILALIIVFFELWAIVWIQNKFMATPFWRASLQVIVGGILVFATGILIGSA
ncbi:VIT1/CCC1 transporter family protein [Bartonella bacilliformis]|uniref:TIGR00267 family protein n=1 Tax=Bartonella bacilliformis Ver097 TaxID=1293911 RepID=A0A072RIQ4_BARBA|nr:hypothetical protein [Bartonella bacilliformis]KEG21424.1 hypothetical protein H710_00373 [Bartonella bacilliformis Ver097]